MLKSSKCKISEGQQKPLHGNLSSVHGALPRV